MARINPGTQRDWANGDIVTSDDYEQDREIITVAINGTDDDLTAHISGAVDSTSTDATKDKHVSNKDLKDIWDSLNNKYDTTDVYSKAELQSDTDGDSGADKVKATPIATSPDTVQGLLEWLYNQQQSTVLGQIPDGAVTPQKLSFDPATQDELDAVKSSVSDGKTIVKNAITGKGGTVLDADGDGFPTHQELADGVNTIQTLVVINGTAADTDVLSGKTYYNTDAKVQRTGSMPNRGAMTITPGTTNQIIPNGYHTGGGIVTGDPDLVSGNIKAGVDIFGVVGATNVIDTTKTTGQAAAGDILTGKGAFVNGASVNGTMPNRGTFNLGLGASVPAGYYSGGTVPSGKKFASGTETVKFPTIEFFQRQNYSTTVSAYLPYIQVSGLTFTPSVILAYGNQTSTFPQTRYIMTYGIGLNAFNASITDIIFTTQSYVDNSNANIYYYEMGSLNSYVNSSGFRIPVPNTADGSLVMTWVAYE